MRSCTILASAVLLTLVGAAWGGPTSDRPQSDSEKLSEILAQMRDLQFKMDRLQGDIALEMRDLKEDLARLKDKVARMERDAAAPRIAGSINPEPPAGLATGAIRLENRYTTAVDVVINGRPFHMIPGEAKVVADVPVGRFTYQVISDNGYTLPQIERFLTSTRTFPITINP
jgi:hypothetical protein